MEQNQGQQPAAPAPAPMNVIGFSEGQFNQLLEAVAAPRPRAHHVRLREPDVFTGDRATYRTFKIQAQRYSAANHLADDDEKILMVMSCIKGPLVDGWANSYTELHFADDEWNVSLEEFWDHLDQAFVDPNEAQNALNSIGRLRQGDHPIQEYIADFEHLARTAGYKVDNPHVEVWFKQGILPETASKVYAHVPMPTTYEGWKTLAIQLDANQLQERAMQLDARARGERWTHQPRAPREHTHQQRAQEPAARNDGTGVVYGGRGQPMDLDATRERVRAPAQPGAEPLCYTCGRGQYDGQDCTRRWHRRRAANQARNPQPPARLRAWEAADFREEVRRWAAEDPEGFRQEGFGTGPA